MIGLPAALRRRLDLLEDSILEGRAVTDDPVLDEIAALLEETHADVLPEVVAHGFVAVSVDVLAPLFDDAVLCEATGEPGPFDDALRLEFMSACIGEVLASDPAESLAEGHLRCGLLAVRVATCDAVLAVAVDGDQRSWPGLFPDHEAFEDDLRARGFVLSVEEWEAVAPADRLALWQADSSAA